MSPELKTPPGQVIECRRPAVRFCALGSQSRLTLRGPSQPEKRRKRSFFRTYVDHPLGGEPLQRAEISRRSDTQRRSPASMNQGVSLVADHASSASRRSAVIRRRSPDAGRNDHRHRRISLNRSTTSPGCHLCLVADVYVAKTSRQARQIRILDGDAPHALVSEQSCHRSLLLEAVDTRSLLTTIADRSLIVEITSREPTVAERTSRSG